MTREIAEECCLLLSRDSAQCSRSLLCTWSNPTIPLAFTSQKRFVDALPDQAKGGNVGHFRHSSRSASRSRRYSASVSFATTIPSLAHRAFIACRGQSRPRRRAPVAARRTHAQRRTHRTATTRMGLGGSTGKVDSLELFYHGACKAFWGRARRRKRGGDSFYMILF